MTKQKEIMIGRLVPALIKVQVEYLGVVLDLVRKLAGKNGADIYILLTALLSGKFEVVNWRLIKPMIATVWVSINERFVANDHFKVDSSDGAEVKIGVLGENFIRRFLSGKGKIEEPVGDQELLYGKLLKESDNSSIVEELGGELRAEITLSEIYALLKRQPNGENGALLTNGSSNTFYVRDIKNLLCPVDVYYPGVSWYLSIVSEKYMDEELSIGQQVFYRNHSRT